MTVIEYSDLPDELAEQRLANGELRFRAGSIALHALRVDFVERRSTRAAVSRLPFHRAEKKVPCIDLDTGAAIKPTQPNAVKLETFVFDALPLTRVRSIIYETDRLDEFAPIKQAEGIDSPATSAAWTTKRNAAMAPSRRDRHSPACGWCPLLPAGNLAAVRPLSGRHPTEGVGHPADRRGPWKCTLGPE